MATSALTPIIIPQASHPGPLLALPPEIREMVYGYCIPQHLCLTGGRVMYRRGRPAIWLEGELEKRDQNYGNEPTDPDGKPWIANLEFPRPIPPGETGLPSLLFVCRQIYDEVTALLYGRNTRWANFSPTMQSKFARLFSDSTKSKMRSMILALHFTYPERAGDEFHLNTDVWDGMLGNLRTLAIAIKPVDRLFLHFGRSRTAGDKLFQTVFEQWEARLRQAIQYVARAVPDTARIFVDCNEDKDTLRIIEELMPGRCLCRRFRSTDQMLWRW